MEKGQTGILILVGVLVALAIAGGAYFLGKSTFLGISTKLEPISQPTPQIVKSQPTPKSESTSSVASPAPNGAGDMANWKTYTNNTYGFLIQYPLDWKTLPTPNTRLLNEQKIILIYDGKLDGSLPNSLVENNYPSNYVGITAIQSNQTPAQYLDEFIDPSLPADVRANFLEFMNRQKYLLGNIQAEKYNELGQGYRENMIVVSNGKSLILISPSLVKSERNRIINQILSTFKFIP